MHATATAQKTTMRISMQCMLTALQRHNRVIIASTSRHGYIIVTSSSRHHFFVVRSSLRHGYVIVTLSSSPRHRIAIVTSSSRHRYFIVRLSSRHSELHRTNHISFTAECIGQSNNLFRFCNNIVRAFWLFSHESMFFINHALNHLIDARVYVMVLCTGRG